MEEDDTEKAGLLNLEEDTYAVNTLILDYYKKIGRKRHLEQFFSLSTAQGDIKDTSSLFWQRMKAQNDSSDSGGKRSESSTEVCRISIKCSVPEPSGSQDINYQPVHETDSPPIITDGADKSEQSDNESLKSDDHSQKSVDVTLDVSTNKPLSPTSSVTSQRKLEWDSLADVGYANESDRKTSSSGLSTVERLALKQQYSNDEKDIDIGTPTAHSTMVDEPKGKSRKSRVTELHSKDIDVVELNMPQSDVTPSINVNVTKQISFKVEKNGGITVEKNARDVSVSPAKITVETENTPKARSDKEIQTSLIKSAEAKQEKSSKSSSNGAPVFISLNTLKRRIRRRRRSKRSLSKKRSELPKDVSVAEKTGEVVSEAESFEYMPGHIYNQNQVQKLGNSAGNKSSLESSGGITTGSSTVSFAQDLERSIELLQKVLKQNKEDSALKKQLIKDLVKKFVTSRYKDDTSGDFLSALSLSSKDLCTRRDYKSTTSTSDANISDQKAARPKKSILRTDTFNANAPSTSQSAPNLVAVSSNDPPMPSTFDNSKVVTSHTESDMSSKDTKSSQELYNKYLDALRKEAYKKHLRNKEKLLKEKLVGSDGAIRQLVKADSKNERLRDLIKDLTKNNYDDGSGDASKIVGGTSDKETEFDLRKQRSHSVFTLSSNNSDNKRDDDKEKRKIDLRNRLQEEIESRLSSKERPIKHHYCCCPHHSSTQAEEPKQKEIKISELNTCAKRMTDIITCGQYGSCVSAGRCFVHNLENCGCKCKSAQVTIPKIVDTGVQCCFPKETNKFKSPRCNTRMIASEMINAGAQCGDSKEIGTSPKFEDFAQPSTSRAGDVEIRHFVCNSCRGTSTNEQKTSQSSQTNIAANILGPRTSEKITSSSSSNPYYRQRATTSKDYYSESPRARIDVIQESTRWTQTDISILPRKAEPTVSDIKIVNEAECAKLVSQSYREVPRPRPKEKQSDTADNTQIPFNDINENFKKRTANYDERNKARPSDKTKDVAIQSDENGKDNNIESGSNYTIPLKGTNMTLLVSVGSNPPSDSNTNGHRSAGINTDQVFCGDNATSIYEECTKAVQCQTDDVVCHIDDYAKSSRETNPELKSLDRNKVTFTNQTKVTNPVLFGNTRYCTYPKEQKKVMLRSNTDGKLSEKCSREPILRLVREKSPENKYKNTIPERTREKSPDSKYKNPILEHSKPKPKETKAAGDTVDTKINKSSPNSDSLKSATSHNSNKPYTINSRSGSPNSKDLASRSNNTENSNHTAESSLKSDLSKSSASKNNNKVTKHSTPNLSNDEEPNKCQNDSEHNCEEGCDCGCASKDSKDPALDMIRDITKRYSKENLEKGKRKKCFKEIMAVLNYLLDTDESTDGEGRRPSVSTENEVETKKKAPNPPKEIAPKKVYKADKITVCTATSPKRLVDKGVQLFQRKSRSQTVICDSSDLPDSSDMPTTSSDTLTCKILEKIKKECEKYHHKRSKCSSKKCESKRCEGSSSTSISCEGCQKVHHCNCRAQNSHKCKHRTKQDKVKKPCVAYNLIIKTSDSFVGDVECESKRQLKNIVFKVPSRRNCGVQNVPFNEMASKLEDYANSKRCPPTRYRFQRSKSLPNESEISSTDDVLKKCPTLTVRDYLEKNRPDFIENTSTRQNCLKMISESRANERAAQRELLSMQVQRDAALNISAGDLRRLAKEVGIEIRRRKPPKLISEREMKKRSEQIYKSLPEVVRKKDEARKENIKKTNLLMASIFKKNLQKKALRGSVNLSNYNTVMKI